MSNIDFEQMYGADAIAAAAERLKTDDAFRAEAQADLNAAVKRHYDVDLPMPMRLVETEGELLAVPVDDSQPELSDEELDMVAGGFPPVGFGQKEVKKGSGFGR